MVPNRATHKFLLKWGVWGGWKVWGVTFGMEEIWSSLCFGWHFVKKNDADVAVAYYNAVP